MASAGLTSVSLEEAYIEGFRTGARIMLAVLQEDKPQESRDEDKAGAIWVSSEHSGLSRITISNEGITRIYPESPDLFDRSNTIRMLNRTDDGNIWNRTENT